MVDEFKQSSSEFSKHPLQSPSLYCKTDKENSVKGDSSEVDYVLLVEDDERALCEAKSPSIMHKVGKVLPQRGIELNWFRGDCDTENPRKGEYAISYQLYLVLKKICLGRFVFRSETYGMAVSYLP